MADLPWVADQIEKRPVADLVPYARNSRTHSAEQVAQLAGAMREFGWTYPVLIDEAGSIIAGHGRILAAHKLKLEEVPVIVASGWSEEKKRAYVIWDNKSALLAGWDSEMLKIEMNDLKGAGFDLSLTGFPAVELAELGIDGYALAQVEQVPKVRLADRFGVPPLSVLNTRDGWWQARKKAWISLGIKSEVGRGGNLLSRSLHERVAFAMGMGIGPGNSYEKAKAAIDEGRAKGLTDSEIIAKAAGAEVGRIEGALAGEGSSIFDPVLAELAYRWWCLPGGEILDPFAGGSVRGIVAAKLKRGYTGIDLRQDQVDANFAQADEILNSTDTRPIWVQGDSANLDELVERTEFDFIFSCPPYLWLEVYSEDPRDLSTMDYAGFENAYRAIIDRAVDRLAPNRFACFVVGDVRDKKGNYVDFPGLTIDAFESAGAHLYNDAVLVTAVGSLALRAGRTFEATRKLGATHQRVLVFVKGDPRAATEAIGKVEFGEVEGATLEATTPPAAEAKKKRQPRGASAEIV